ncbi:hypothetical protein BDV25DRAFT_160316 [Aspergillus avenaceus]|uniref:NTP binding protein n=1 Tax=Aspergillus avenaceus TaxID=36643 RepID=A0A5N6TMV3_ASPAV|nr:hypothetical protein BDV25DRAFT_160316 [Aspergillus avenaceus]
MCREPPCQWPEKQELFPNPTGKENTKCSSSAPRQQDQKNSSGDDVFIITPTITRTMVSVADPRSAMYRRPGIQQPISRTTGEVIPGAKAKPQTNWTPSGLRRVTQNSWGKTKAPFPAPSRPTPVRNTPVIFQTRSEPGRVGVERRRAIRGYIRMPGMVKSRTENLGQRMHHAHPWQGAAASLPSKEELHPARSMSDSSQSFSSSIHDMSPTNSLTKDQRSVKEPVQSARIVEVAELDGLQVDDPKEDRKTENKDNCKSDNKAQTGCIRVEFTDRGAGRQKGGAVQHGTKAILDSVTFGLIMDILILSAAQAQALYTQVMDNRHSRVMVLRIALDCILRMVEHCLHVLKDILNAFSVYNSTGTWPRPSEKDLPRSLTDFCQALIYLVALGFIAMFLVRMVGYVVLVGYWVVWFTRPLGWALGGLGRALLP